jgi:hypothetical protein
MAVLEGLRATGRTVGIISHVPSRIDKAALAKPSLPHAAVPGVVLPLQCIARGDFSCMSSDAWIRMRQVALERLPGLAEDEPVQSRSLSMFRTSWR